MTKPRQLKTFLFKVTCKNWKSDKKIRKLVEFRSEGAFDALDIDELEKIIEHLINCREWMEEEVEDE